MIRYPSPPAIRHPPRILEVSLHTRISTVMLAAGALALAAGASTLPAVASASTSAATWTVTPGGQYRAQVRDDNFWGILDVRTNQEIHCTVNASAWSMRLRFKKGTGLSDPIGWVRSLSFPKPCFPGGMGPVTLSAAGHTVGDQCPRLRPGRPGDQRPAHPHASGALRPALCRDPRRIGRHGQRRHRALRVQQRAGRTLQTAYSPGSGNLHAYQVTGCRQMLHRGDVVRLFFGYDLNRALTVTSP